MAWTHGQIKKTHGEQSRTILPDQDCEPEIRWASGKSLRFLIFNDIDVMPNCSYNLVVSFEWDESKRKVNIQKHGIDFVDAKSIFDGLTVTLEDTRFDYGETRYITLGLLKGHVIVLAHTERGEKIRIISARKATNNEAKIYFDQIAD